MGKMSYISYLASKGNLKELMEEVGPIAKMTGRSCKEVAQGFIDACDEIEENQGDDAFKTLHELNQQNIAEGQLEHKKRNTK